MGNSCTVSEVELPSTFSKRDGTRVAAVHPRTTVAKRNRTHASDAMVPPMTTSNPLLLQHSGSTVRESGCPSDETISTPSKSTSISSMREVFQDALRNGQCLLPTFTETMFTSSKQY